MTTRGPLDRVLAWDGVEPLDPVWRELAVRMGASERPVRRITVTGLGESGRRKLASLLGLTRVPARGPTAVDVDRLGAALGLDAAQLRQLVEHVCGSIENRAAARAATSDARSTLWARVDARLGARVPLTVARLRAAGIPDGDVAAHADMLQMLADSLELLPASVPIPLPMLAWRVSGDPHALDPNTTCGRYLQLAAAELAGTLAGSRDPDPVVLRRALQEFGVIADRLSSATLTYGLRATPNLPLGTLLEAAAAVRAPVHVSGSMLDRGTPAYLQPEWLCVENPSVVEAAMLAGHDGPIVCTSGWPSLDTQRLLEQAREHGVALRYAGDYDPAGLAIARFMVTRYDASVVMTAPLYLAADLQRAPCWTEPPPSTPWDPELAVAISATRRIVFQEDPAVWRAVLERSAPSR